MASQVVRGPLPLMLIRRSRNRLPSTEGTSLGPPPTQRFLRTGEAQEDLMSPDLLSEIVLLGFGALILVSLLLFVVIALTRT